MRCETIVFSVMNHNIVFSRCEQVYTVVFILLCLCSINSLITLQVIVNVDLNALRAELCFMLGIFFSCCERLYRAAIFIPLFLCSTYYLITLHVVATVDCNASRAECIFML